MARVTPDFGAQLHQLDSAALRRIAVLALGTGEQDLRGVESLGVTPLGGGASGASVFRLSGLVRRSEGSPVEWSAVVKCRRPSPNRRPVDRSWCREASAYAAGLVPQDSALGFVGARCLAIDERPDGAVWLWSEDLARHSFAGSGDWTMERHCLAARHLGRFNGLPLATNAVPSHAWLCQGQLNYWVHQLLAGGSLSAAQEEVARHPLGFARVIGDLVETYLQQPRAWAAPRLRAAYPQPLAGRLLRLWRARHDLLSAVDRLPPTLLHGDAHPRNFFSRTAPTGAVCTVAIDWENVGRGPVGEDVGRYLGVVLLMDTSRLGRAHELASVMVDGYLEGLRDAGLHVTAARERAARFAAYVNAAFVMGFWAATLPPASLANEPWAAPIRAGVESLIAAPMEAVVEGWASAAYVFLDLAEQALGWLPDL